MPLSEEEQKILKEIEAQLNATDPALVEQVSRTTLYRHSARVIRWAALGFFGGLVLLVLTFAQNLWAGARRIRSDARVPARSSSGTSASSARRGWRASPAGGRPVAASAASSASTGAPGASASAATTPDLRWASRSRWPTCSPRLKPSRLSGCTVSQLRHWSRRGLVDPSGARPPIRLPRPRRAPARALAARRRPAVGARRCRVSRTLRRHRVTTSRACAS